MNRPMRFHRLLALAGAVAVVAACQSSSVAGLVGTPAHWVYITPGTPQHGPNGDTVYLDIQNQGAGTAYLQPCGDGPLLDLQVNQNGNWQTYGPAITCPVQTVPGPIPLNVAAQLVVSRVFPSGTYRAGVYVGTTVTMSDAAEAYTVSFKIP